MPSRKPKTKQQAKAAATPAAAAAAASPPAAPPSGAKGMADTILRAHLARIAQRVQRGEQVSQADLRMLQSVQASETGTAWPDRESCAAELTADFKDSVRVGTLYEWVRRGAPIPRAGPIPKLALYRWLACEKRLAGRPVGGTSAPSDKKEKLLERQVQHLALKVNTLAGATVSIDDAALVIDTAVEDLKTALRHDLPPKAAELARAAGSDELAVEAIREAVDTCLGAIAAAADQYQAKAEKAKQTLQDAAS